MIEDTVIPVAVVAVVAPAVVAPAVVAPFPSLSSPWTRHLIQLVVSLALSILVSWLATKGIVIPPALVPVVPAESTPPPPQTRAMGLIHDPKAIAESYVRLPVTHFSDTPAGRVAQGDVPDTFLWDYVRKAAGQSAPWYSNIDQKDVGCCVGCGWKHASDVVQAVQCVTKGGTWKPLSVEVIYGASRVNVGKGGLSGDGSVGAWAREAVRDFGEAAMAKYAGGDLTTFSPQRARQYGDQGVPTDILVEAKNHTVEGTALVSSWTDVQRSISQGYPIAVCSNVGFNGMNRDSEGFVRASGSWPHCMSFIGVRGGTRPGAFCLNSWGDSAHGGPTWPAGAPVAGFWVDAATVDRMVKQGDSFSLADLKGFPSRRLDWSFETSKE